MQLLQSEERPLKVCKKRSLATLLLILQLYFLEDEELGKGLLNSEKDRAEHIMLVDLARNDVNRVCQPKTVKVDHLMQLDKFSHVIHMTSQVSGMLREDKDRLVRRVQFHHLQSNKYNPLIIQVRCIPVNLSCRHCLRRPENQSHRAGL